MEQAQASYFVDITQELVRDQMAQYIMKAMYHAHHISTKAELVQYHYQPLFSPPPTTTIKAEKMTC